MSRRILLIALLTASFVRAQEAPAAGPPRGTLIVIGGGRVGPAILDRFTAAAGGPDANIVVIPTAGEAASYPPDWGGARFLGERFKNITVLHTRDRAQADSEEFAASLQRAGGVWISGGRQWRLVDSYLGTRTERELHALLARGGVIAGTSAGATIQGSYLVRGAREGNTIMMAKGYEQGFGFLRNVAVDQHLLKRKRENDLVPVVEAHPELLGIGIDESTAIVVVGSQFEVIGESKVGIYESRLGRNFYFLSSGERFDLGKRERLK